MLEYTPTFPGKSVAAEEAHRRERQLLTVVEEGRDDSDDGLSADEALLVDSSPRDLPPTKTAPAGTKKSLLAICMMIILMLVAGVHNKRSPSFNVGAPIPTTSAASPPPDRCLSTDRDVHDLIASSDQVILVMPAKAAGSSSKAFAKSCNDEAYERLGDNFMNHKSQEDVLTNSFQPPGVIASHVTRAESFIKIIRNIPRRTLLIYSHREETSRLLSGIKQVVTNRVCAKKWIDGSCHIEEKDLIGIIKSQEAEIGFGATRVLTCDTHRAIKSFAPTMVWMDYKRASALQNILAEKYCPSLVGNPMKVNVATDKNDRIYVSSSSLNVTLQDWLQSKASTIEWSLGLRDGAECVGNTREMEDQLFACESGFMSAKETGSLV